MHNLNACLAGYHLLQFHGVPSVPVPPAMVAMFEQMWGMQHQQQQQQQQSAQYQDQSNLYVNGVHLKP
jgi:hypothetical protein